MKRVCTAIPTPPTPHPLAISVLAAATKCTADKTRSWRANSHTSHIRHFIISNTNVWLRSGFTHSRRSHCSARLSSMDNFSIIDKNEGMCCLETQHKCCLKCLAVFSIRKPNFVSVTQRQFSCLYRASATIITLYYPTDAQIYNS